MVNTTISTFCAAGIDFGGYRFINYVSRWEFSKTRGTLCWGPYEDPTI